MGFGAVFVPLWRSAPRRDKESPLALPLLREFEEHSFINPSFLTSERRFKVWMKDFDTSGFFRYEAGRVFGRRSLELVRK